MIHLQCLPVMVHEQFSPPRDPSEDIPICIPRAPPYWKTSWKHLHAPRDHTISTSTWVPGNKPANCGPHCGPRNNIMAWLQPSLTVILEVIPSDWKPTREGLFLLQMVFPSSNEQTLMQDYVDHEKEGKYDNTKGKFSFSNWPQRNWDLSISWQRFQNNHLKETQWNAREHRQWNEIKNTMHEQNKRINEEIENIKEPNRNPGSEKYNDRIEKFNRELLNTGSII